jgi:hypothetical protein
VAEKEFLNDVGVSNKGKLYNCTALPVTNQFSELVKQRNDKSCDKDEGISEGESGAEDEGGADESDAEDTENGDDSEQARNLVFFPVLPLHDG